MTVVAVAADQDRSRAAVAKLLCARPLTDTQSTRRQLLAGFDRRIARACVVRPGLDDTGRAGQGDVADMALDQSPIEGRSGARGRFRRIRPHHRSLLDWSRIRIRRKNRLPRFFGHFRPLKTYGRIGDLEVRLARTRADLRLAQRLRYEVFYQEMSAKPSIKAQVRRRDEDRYDNLCDHLLVIDVAATQQTKTWRGKLKPRVVGTYRVLRQEIAEKSYGFYTQGEYDIAPLVTSKPELKFLELGRSCVLKPYRTKRSVELLWHGLWTYIREHKMDVMIGCASFEGVDPQEHATALSFLHHTSLAPPEWRVRAHDHIRVEMNRMPKEQVNTKAALKALPPLIKAYLRLGAFVGDGAVIDRQFGTVDVMIIMPVAKIDPRYFEHYGAPDEVKSRVAV